MRQVGYLQEFRWKSLPDTSYLVEQGTSWIPVKDRAEHEREKLCYHRNLFHATSTLAARNPSVPRNAVWETLV